LIKKHGSTSNIERFTIKNSSTGVGLTGLTEASAGLIISTICNNEATATTYTQAGSTIETIAALGTYAAPTATKCRFKEVDATNHKGLYEFQIADARYAIASARSVAISVTGAASLLDADYEIQLVSFDPYDAADLGLSTLTGNTPQSADNNTILAHGTYGSSALQVLIAALQTDLDNSTDGLGALKTLIDAVPTASEIQTEIEENGASVVDTIRDYIENVTYGLSALKTLIDTVNTDLSNGTDGLGALKALIDTNKSELDGLQGTDGKCLISTDVQNLIASLIVDAEDSVCDALLTGTSHNIVTSLGRRVREIGAFAIESGTAQSGTLNSIKLAVTANDEAGVLNRNLIVLTDNTGKGQTRTIVDYNAITKVAIVDRDWRVIPDNTTAYQVVPDDTPLIVDHGVAQGGTSTTIKIREYASSTNNAYWCNIVAILAGKGRGQARLVGSYDGTTKVITICGENWVEIPDTTSVYVMMPYGTTCTSCLSASALALINTEVDNALNTVIPGSPTAGSINEKIKALPSGIAKNVALNAFTFYMVLSSDHVTAATGKTLIIGQISKDGGAFAGLTNSITEIGNGLYKVDIIQAEMNADVVTLKFTETDCDQRVLAIYTS
jgi:hypothetical protein